MEAGGATEQAAPPPLPPITHTFGRSAHHRVAAHRSHLPLVTVIAPQSIPRHRCKFWQLCSPLCRCPHMVSIPTCTLHSRPRSKYKAHFSNLPIKLERIVLDQLDHPGVVRLFFTFQDNYSLSQLLDVASKALPLVVLVSGRVGSDTPINCEYSGLRGVIVEQTAEHHFLKHNDTGSWIQDSALMLSMCKEVPWYLDDGTSRVHVVGAHGASGLVLTVGSELFEESGRGASYMLFTSIILEGFNSSKGAISFQVLGPEAAKSNLGATTS